MPTTVTIESIEIITQPSRSLQTPSQNVCINCIYTRQEEFASIGASSHLRGFRGVDFHGSRSASRKYAPRALGSLSRGYFLIIRWRSSSTCGAPKARRFGDFSLLLSQTGRARARVYGNERAILRARTFPFSLRTARAHLDKFAVQIILIVFFFF